MRTEFTYRLVQRWLLVGLNEWQSCLVRQQLDYAKNQRNEAFGKSSDSKDQVLDLQVLSFTEQQIREQNSKECLTSASDLESGTASEKILPMPVDIVVVSADCCQLLRTVNFQASVVRLLWDWGPSKRHAFELVRSLGGQGVIRCPESLRSWIQISFRSGPKACSETHPLLAKINLPTLSIQSKIDQCHS